MRSSEKQREAARSSEKQLYIFGDWGAVPLLAMTILVCAPALLGANCSPSRTSRDRGCSRVTCPVGSNGVQQLPRCINFCADQPPLASAEGSRCALDACDATAWSASNVFMCPSNFGCVPNPADPGFGRCHEDAPNYLGQCDPAGNPPCPTQSYCRQFSAAFPRPTWFRPTTAAGACVTWVREGGLCNGGSGSTSPADDLRCEPGTECLAVIDPVFGTPLPGVRRCQRACESDLDCPCSTANRPISCTPSGGSLRTCTYCTASGQACDVGSGAGACCDPVASCQVIQGVPGLPSGTRQCCRSNGASCTSHEDCCGNSRCAGSTCQACSPVGAAPGAPGCCPGLTPVSYNFPSPFQGQTLCSEPCERIRGEPSTLTYTGQSCRPDGAGPGCTAAVLCGPRGYDCIPSTGTPDTTCNNLDEDCDGRRDEHWDGGPCDPGLPPGVMCDNVFTPLGDKVCDGGVESCRPREFCRTDISGQLVFGSAGGRSCESRQVFCKTSADCQGSEQCGPSGSTCSGFTLGCCAFRSCPTCPETFAPCCAEDLSRINTCYYPTT